MFDKEKKSKKVSQARKRRPLSKGHQLTSKNKTGKKSYNANEDPLFILWGLVLSLPLLGGGILIIILIGFAFWKLLFG